MAVNKKATNSPPVTPTTGDQTTRSKEVNFCQSLEPYLWGGPDAGLAVVEGAWGGGGQGGEGGHTHPAGTRGEGWGVAQV